MLVEAGRKDKVEVAAAVAPGAEEVDLEEEPVLRHEKGEVRKSTG